MLSAALSTLRVSSALAACGGPAPALQAVSQVSLSPRLLEITFTNPLINPPLAQTKVRIPQFGVVAAQSNQPRIIQFAMKVIY